MVQCIIVVFCYHLLSQKYCYGHEREPVGQSFITLVWGHARAV